MKLNTLEQFLGSLEMDGQTFPVETLQRVELFLCYIHTSLDIFFTFPLNSQGFVSNYLKYTICTIQK